VLAGFHPHWPDLNLTVAGFHSRSIQGQKRVLLGRCIKRRREEAVLFRTFAFAGAAAALLAISLPAMADPLSTDVSAQGVTIDPGAGPRVRVGPDRDRRRHDRRESRGDGGDRRCVTEYTTRTTPSGRTIREKKTVCR
jgi:hypothetical protein